MKAWVIDLQLHLFLALSQYKHVIMRNFLWRNGKTFTHFQYNYNHI